MRRLVLSIVTALLIVLPPVSVFAIDQLSVAPQDQVCNVDDDCVIVSTRCDACECCAPVNKVHEQAYIERYRALCENYYGLICDYDCQTPFTACRDHRCVPSAAPSDRKFNTQYIEPLIALCDPLRRFEHKPPIDLGQAPEGWQVRKRAILASLVAQFDDTTPVLAPGSKDATVHNEIYRFRKCDYAYYVFATITGQAMEEFGTARNPSTPERRDQRIRELKQWWAEHWQQF